MNDIWTQITKDETTWPPRGVDVIIATPVQPTVGARNELHRQERGCWFGYQFVPYEGTRGLYWRYLIKDIDIIRETINYEN